MKKKDLVISLLVGILAGILLTFTETGNNWINVTPASAQSSMDTILLKMLNSHKNWTTAQGNAKVVWGDNAQAYTLTFTIQQPSKVYIDTSNVAGKGNDGILVIDGENAYNLDKHNKSFSLSAFPSKFQEASYLPTKLTDLNPNSVVVHPLMMSAPSPVTEYLFSSWFAQGHKGDVYSLEREENIIGRKAWVVNIKTIYDDDVTAWVDKRTGVILRYIQITSGQKFADFRFTNIQFDAPIMLKNIFTVPDGYTQNLQ